MSGLVDGRYLFDSCEVVSLLSLISSLIVVSDQ
jgi:hypothetical protein